MIEQIGQEINDAVTPAGPFRGEVPADFNDP
jgi:hypothetical protein